MIPYDDLVAALAAWRERQGLPVSTLAPPARATPVPARDTPSPGSGPSRGAPPPPPGGRATPAEALDVEDAALLAEEHYDNEGGDFAMAFGNEAEATAIGNPPDRDSQGGSTDPSPRPFGGRSTDRNDDW